MLPHILFLRPGVGVRKRVYLLVVSCVLLLATVRAPGQSRGAESAGQGRASAPAFDPELSDYKYPYPVGFYEFDRLKTPALLVIGQRDRTAIGRDRVPKETAARMGDYPALGKAAARRIPGARLIEIEEAGHLPQLDSFRKYAHALLDFIAER